MDRTKTNELNDVDSRGTTDAKAAYDAPKILSREFLEAVAAACPAPNGKAQGQGGCVTPSS